MKKKKVDVKCPCCHKRKHSQFNPFYCDICIDEAAILRQGGCMAMSLGLEK